jgi:hypothetical protein
MEPKIDCQGSSSARVNGRLVADSARAIQEAFGPQEFERLLDALPEAARKTMQGPILVSDWVPVDHFALFLEATVRMHYRGDERTLLRGSEKMLGEKLSGPQRFYIRSGSPEQLFRRLETMTQSYWSGVAMEASVTGERTARVRYTGFARNHRILEKTLSAFYHQALKLSGAKTVETRWATPIGQGKPFAEIIVSWS